MKIVLSPSSALFAPLLAQFYLIDKKSLWNTIMKNERIHGLKKESQATSPSSNKTC